MTTKQIPLKEFHEGMERAVLAALDEYVRDVMETHHISGARDNELKPILTAIKAHAETVAQRLNMGHEINSAYISIKMEDDRL